jgi:hypothetical protein
MEIMQQNQSFGRWGTYSNSRRYIQVSADSVSMVHRSLKKISKSKK